MCQGGELAVAHHFAAEGDDESLAAELVDIGRGGGTSARHVRKISGFTKSALSFGGMAPHLGAGGRWLNCRGISGIGNHRPQKSPHSVWMAASTAKAAVSVRRTRGPRRRRRGTVSAGAQAALWGEAGPAGTIRDAGGGRSRRASAASAPGRGVGRFPLKRREPGVQPKNGPRSSGTRLRPHSQPQPPLARGARACPLSRRSA